MSNKEQKAMERLVAKLSAVRKTLRGEERRLLDQIVLSTRAEITLHNVKQSAKTAEGKAAGAAARTEAKFRASNVTGKQAGKAQAAHSEVALHSANVASKADSANASATAGKLARQQADSIATGHTMRVAIDAKSKSYAVIVE